MQYRIIEKFVSETVAERRQNLQELLRRKGNA